MMVADAEWEERTGFFVNGLTAKIVNALVDNEELTSAMLSDRPL
jgi:hypothetical protein